ALLGPGVHLFNTRRQPGVVGAQRLLQLLGLPADLFELFGVLGLVGFRRLLVERGELAKGSELGFVGADELRGFLDVGLGRLGAGGRRLLGQGGQWQGAEKKREGADDFAFHEWSLMFLSPGAAASPEFVFPAFLGSTRMLWGVTLRGVTFGWQAAT